MLPIVSQVSTKRVEAICVLSLREEIDSFPEQGRLWKTLLMVATDKGITAVGPRFAVHHNLGAVVGKSGKIDVEVCIPVDSTVDVGSWEDGVRVHELPEIKNVAFVTLAGACVALPQAYTTLFEGLKAMNLAQDGPTREIYLIADEDPMSDTYRCEVQVPVAPH